MASLGFAACQSKNALGIRYLPTMRPARATLIFHYFLQLSFLLWQAAEPSGPGLWRSLGFLALASGKAERSPFCFTLA